MSDDKEFARAVADRLRAIMAELEMDSVRELAEFLGEKRAAVSNWLQAYNLPPVQAMGQLARKTGLTLDFIYLGDIAALSYAKGIRLQARLAGLALPDDSGQEPQPEQPSGPVAGTKPQQPPEKTKSGSAGAKGGASAAASVKASKRETRSSSKSVRRTKLYSLA